MVIMYASILKRDGREAFAVLPFEEFHSVEGHRLRTCATGFAFEDPDTGVVRTVPVCTWGLYRDGVERKIATKHGTAPSREPAQTTGDAK